MRSCSGATTPGDAHGVARQTSADAVLTARPTAANRRALLELMFTPTWLDAHPEARVPMGGVVPAYARALHYAASQGHDAWDRLPRITAPVLLLHGTDDQVNVSDNADLLAQRIPGAELQVLPGARHGYLVEEAATATPLVLDFLARHRF